jgi:hypothetical protein
MFVMDSQGLSGLAYKARRTAWPREQLLPITRGILEAPAATMKERQRTHSIHPNQRLTGAFAHQDRAVIRGARAGVESAASVDAAERQGLLCIDGRFRALPDQVQEASCQAGERQQVEPVVLEDRSQRSGVAGADELKIP